jgi:hypothetical protein
VFTGLAWKLSEHWRENGERANLGGLEMGVMGDMGRFAN